MAEAIRMPKMSDTMTEGVIVAWHKKVGDKVKSGDLLAEVETDKAVMELESFQEGTLLYIGADKGQAVKVDSVIAVLGKEGEDFKGLLNEDGVTEKKEAEEKAGDKKEEAEVPKSDQKVSPKKEKQQEQKEVIEKEPVPPPTTDEKQPSPQNERVKASPLAKKIASESGIAIDKVKGTADGRIVKRDVEKYLTEHAAMGAQVSAEESYEDVPLSMMRKTIARRLTESMFTAPHFYLTMHINVNRCVEARNALNAVNPDAKISFNDIIVKATALALKKHTKVNASWIEDRIRYNHHVHIGVAVAVDEGLLVPVIRFADQKSLLQIGQEVHALAAKAREKKLQPEEMQGNTFTISNLGMMDIDEFTAIINPPDSCILAVGKVKKSAEVIDDQVKIVNMLTVTMSCDHRVVDGATGASFLQTLKSNLENPLMMLY